MGFRIVDKVSRIERSGYISGSKLASAEVVAMKLRKAIKSTYFLNPNTLYGSSENRGP